MLFRLLFKVLKNLGWVVSIALVFGGLFFAYTQYQAIKSSPLGGFLPSITLPAFPTGQTLTTSPTVLPTQAQQTTNISIETSQGKVSYLSEIARTEGEKALGLMYRTTLPQYAGMYFVYESDVKYGFWMKNCEIPLDMIFIDSQQIIIDLKENVRPCKEVDPTQTNCPTYTPKAQYRTVLEINGGSAKKNNIAIGQKITLAN